MMHSLLQVLLHTRVYRQVTGVCSYDKCYCDSHYLEAGKAISLLRVDSIIPDN